MTETSLEAAVRLRDEILRGDIVIGLKSPDAWDDMVRMFESVGDAGNAAAWYELGRALADGLNTFEPDLEGAATAYEKAWEGGFGRQAGLAFVRTAYFARLERGVTVRDVIETLQADDDDGQARLLAGWMHYAGYAFAPDLARAVELHTSAAEAGNADAMFELSVLYGTGQGVEPDPEASTRWCVKAAEAGNTRAMYNLGGSYATGRGVELDPELAVDWYRKAAFAGHGRAAATLSVMYATGDGAPLDVEEAHEYANLAWECGFDAYVLYDAMGIEPPFDL